MKKVKLTKEILKLIILAVLGIVFFVLGYYVFSEEHYSSAILGMAGAAVGLVIFQLMRISNFIKNPISYEKEQVNIKDERNNIILNKSKAESYDVELFVLFGVTIYAIYLNNIVFVVSLCVLWVIRIGSFFYYISKNNKKI